MRESIEFSTPWRELLPALFPPSKHQFLHLDYRELVGRIVAKIYNSMGYTVLSKS
jgi:hypothetical protein